MIEKAPGESGIVSDSLQLDTDPITGKWKIVVTTLVSYTQHLYTKLKHETQQVKHVHFQNN